MFISTINAGNHSPSQSFECISWENELIAITFTKISNSTVAALLSHDPKNVVKGKTAANSQSRHNNLVFRPYHNRV